MMRVLALLLHDVYERAAAESRFVGPGADRYKLSMAELEAPLAGVGRARADRPILVSASARRTSNEARPTLHFDRAFLKEKSLPPRAGAFPFLKRRTVMTQNTAMTKSREQRWAEEATFFDTQAERITDDMLAIDPLATARYSQPVPRRRFNKEFRFRLMGPLSGKRILDVGCGDGLNTVQFAKLGADVTGIDLSTKEIEIARRRALVAGVSDRVRLVCSPIEIADLADESFDIVWVDAILHHLLDELEPTMCRLVSWARPEGLLVFAEPVNLCEPLRRLRKMIPVRTEATLGERPLVKAEIETVMRYLACPRIRYYMLLGRLDRFILVRHNYERSPLLRRAASNAIAFTDYALLSLPGFKRLGAACVIYGHPRKAAVGA